MSKITMSENLSYRADIDGLRAISVLAVFIYHLNRNLLPSGYLGVDSFFVISGFVITKSLFEHKSNNIVDFIVSFYSRRVRRIYPALLVVLLFSAFSSCLLVPSDYSEFGSSLSVGFAAIFGFANVYLERHAADYFATSVLRNPFLHTWSLGVEEQFYLVYPPLLWLLGFAKSRTATGQVRLVLCALALLSLTSFLTMSSRHPVAVFYLPWFRFWELSAGCLVCLSMQSRSAEIPAIVKRTLSLAGAAAMLATFGSREDLSVWTTPVMIASVSALLYALDDLNPISLALRYRVMTWLGLRSYSLYLWHWPMIVLAKRSVGLSVSSSILVVSLSLLLAHLSYRWIEQPFRTRWKSLPKLAPIAIALAAALGCGLAFGFLRAGKAARLFAGAKPQIAASGSVTLHDDKYAEGGRLLWRARNCVLESDDDVGKNINLRACTLKGSNSAPARRIFVIGNSYSAAEFEMYSGLAERGRADVIVTSSWGASPVEEVRNESSWAKANQYYWGSVVPPLLHEARRGDIVLMLNDMNDFAPKIWTAESDDKLGKLATGLQRLVRELDARGIHIVFQTPTPLIGESGCNPVMAKTQWFNFGRAPCLYYSRAETVRRQTPVMEMLQSLQAANKNFQLLDLMPVLCPGDVCEFYSKEDLPLYRDEWSHLSIEADLLARPLLEA